MGIKRKRACRFDHHRKYSRWRLDGCPLGGRFGRLAGVASEAVRLRTSSIIGLQKGRASLPCLFSALPKSWSALPVRVGQPILGLLRASSFPSGGGALPILRRTLL